MLLNCHLVVNILELQPWRRPPRPYDEDYGGDGAVEGKLLPPERQAASGCPVAIVERVVSFPAPLVLPLGSYDSQTSEHLYINMMPFRYHDEESLPDFCRQYWPIIQECVKRTNLFPNATAISPHYPADEGIG